jgi:hypothetical protein
MCGRNLRSIPAPMAVAKEGTVLGDAVVVLIGNGGDCAGGDGLVRAAEEDVRERRDASGKRDLGADQADVLMDAAGAVVERGAVVVAEIGGKEGNARWRRVRSRSDCSCWGR